MRSRVVGLVAAAALVASVGIANAADNATANVKGPVKLTDNQLDKVTAGSALDGLLAAVNANVAADLAFSASLVNLSTATTAFATAAITP
jgi:hypothetical protein